MEKLLKEKSKDTLEFLEKATGKKHYIKKLKKDAPWSEDNFTLDVSSKERYYCRGQWHTLEELENLLDNIGGLLGISCAKDLKFALDTGFTLADNGLLPRPCLPVGVLPTELESFTIFILTNIAKAGMMRGELLQFMQGVVVTEFDSNAFIANDKMIISTLDFVINRRQMVGAWLQLQHATKLSQVCTNSIEVEEVLEAQTDIYMEKACWIIAKHYPERRGNKDRFS